MKVSINHNSKNYTTDIDFSDVKIHHTKWLKSDKQVNSSMRKAQREIGQQLRDNFKENALVKESNNKKLEELADFFDAVSKAQANDSRANRTVGLKTQGMTKQQIAKQAKKNLKNRNKIGSLATNFVKNVAPEAAGSIPKLASIADKTKRLGGIITTGEFELDGSSLAKALNVGSLASDAVSVVFPEVGAITRGVSLITSGLMKTKALRKLAPTATAARNVISKVNKAKNEIPMTPANLVKHAKETLYSKVNLAQFSAEEQKTIQNFLDKAEQAKVPLKDTDEYKSLSKIVKLDPLATDESVYAQSQDVLKRSTETAHFDKLKKADPQTLSDEDQTFMSNFNPKEAITLTDSQLESVYDFKNVYEQAQNTDVKDAIMDRIPGLSEFNQIKNSISSKGDNVTAATDLANDAYNELRTQLIGYKVAKGHNSPSEFETQVNLANLEASMEAQGVRGKFNKKTADSLREILDKLPDYAKDRAQDYISYTNALDPATAISMDEGGNLNIDFDQYEDADFTPVTSNASIWTGKEAEHSSDVFKFWTGQLDTSGPSFMDIVDIMINDSGTSTTGVWSPYTDALEKVYRFYEPKFGDGPLKLDDWLKFKMNSGKIQYVSNEMWFQSTGPGSSAGESKGFLDMMRDLKEALIELGANVPNNQELDDLYKDDTARTLDKLNNGFTQSRYQLDVEQTTNDDGTFDPIGFNNFLNS